MKNRQTILGLLIAIAVLVGVHLYLDVGGRSSSRVRRSALLPSAHGATSITVARRGARPLRLEKAEAWRIVEPFSALADQRGVLRLLDALAFSDPLDEHSEAELLKLGLESEDFGLIEPRISVLLSNGEGVTNAVFIGSSNSERTGVYAAVGDRRTVYVVGTNVLSAADCSPRQLRCRELFALSGAEAVSFDVIRGAQSFSRFVRDGAAWRMTEPKASVASSKRVAALLDTVLSATARDFVWPVGNSNEVASVSASLLAGYGLDGESASTLTVRGVGGADRTISFGKDAGNGLVYALVFNGSAIATVDAALKERFCAESEALMDARLFPCDVETVRTLSLTDGESAFLLARDAEGAWRLDAPISAAADSETVGALLSRILALKPADRVENGVLVSVSTNTEPVSVRRAAVLSGIRLEDLRARDVVRITPDAVRRIVVTPGGAQPTAVVYDDERKEWKVESAERVGTVDIEAVNDILGALNPLQASSVVRLRVNAAALTVYGLDKPRFTVAVDQNREGSVRRNILIGERTSAGSYATVGAADAVFVIPEETVRKLALPLVIE